MKNPQSTADLASLKFRLPSRYIWAIRVMAKDRGISARTLVARLVKEYVNDAGVSIR